MSKTKNSHIYKKNVIVMNEKLLLEIQRINQLIGVISINEQPISIFSRVGLKESIIIVKNQADQLINLFKKGHIKADELKKQMQKNIDEYKNYLDEATYNTIKKDLDDLVTNTNLKSNADDVGVKLQKQIDDLETTLDDLEKNIDIELKSFENGVRKRFTDWLDNYTNKEGKIKIVESSTNVLDQEGPLGGGTIGDDIIKSSDNETAVDDLLMDAVITHDKIFIEMIDNSNLLPNVKTKLKELIENTQFTRIENLKQKIKENPKYNEKFRSNTNHLEKYYNKILKKHREKRTASEQRFLNEYHNVRNKSMTPDELKQINDLYDVAKKSSSLEYTAKVNILKFLGTEWLQFIKTLIESFAGFRKTADDWAKEAEKSAQILFDELESFKFSEENIYSKEHRSNFNSKVKQFKNEMQLSVSDWSGKYGHDFDAIWTNMKTKMKDLASKNQDKTAVDSVDSLIKKCEERNYKGDIITRNFPGWGGWKSIGDILDLTKNNIESLPPRGYIEPATRTSSLNIINNFLIKLKDLGIKFKAEFNDVRKNFGFTDALNKLRERNSKLGDKAKWYQKAGNGLRFVFGDLIRIWIRKMFSGQYINVDVLISKLSSRGISKKNTGLAFPQLIPRLLSLTVLVNLFNYVMDPFRELVGDLAGWIGEAFIKNIPGLSDLLVSSGIPIEYVGTLGEAGQEISDMVSSPQRLLENFTIEFGLDPIKANLLFFDFALLPQLISDNIIFNKDQLQEQINQANKDINDEFQKWDDEFRQKFNNASPEEKKKLKEESVGTAFLAMNQMNSNVRKNAFINIMKQRNPDICANFDINKFNYVTKNVEYTTGAQPMFLAAIIKDRNENVGRDLNNILKKYVNDPKMAINDFNKVLEKSKNVVDGEISKNNGVVALLKGSDGKKYSLFTDGDLFFYKPSYDEIITTLKNQEFIKDESGTSMVLSNAGENFKMESKHICEFPFP
jgi:hypothetical protein